jgi:hypothetical protein
MSLFSLYLLQDRSYDLDARIVALKSLREIGFKDEVHVSAKIVYDSEKEFSILKATALFILSSYALSTQEIDEIVNDLRSWNPGVNKDVDRLVKELLMVIPPAESFMNYLRELCEDELEYLPYLARLVRT